MAIAYECIVRTESCAFRLVLYIVKYCLLPVTGES